MAGPGKHPQSSPPSGQDEARNSVDYISSLPEALIHHIISFLATEDAVKTSVLSKQWRSWWTSSPHIALCLPEDRVPQLHNFTRFVDSVLSRSTATEVKRLVFDVAYHPCLDSTVEKCLEFVREHAVQELSLTLHCKWTEAYVLMPYFFQLTTLVSLQLSGCNLWFMNAVNWSSLKKLCIGYARLINPALNKLLRGCPVLEFLELKGCDGSKLISVESRGLRELVIDSPTFRSWDGSISNIRAPHLLKLRLLGNNTSIEFRVDRVTCLVEAELNFSMKISGRNNAKARADLVKSLLERLRHVTRLMIGSWCLQILSAAEVKGMPYPSSRWRNIKVYTTLCKSDLLGIVYLLQSSPLLERLVICNPESDNITIKDFSKLLDFDEMQFWHLQKEFCCVSNHLQRVEIVGFELDNEKSKILLALAKFLLEEAVGLEKMIIVLELRMSRGGVPIDPHDLGDFHDVIQLQEGCRRASRNAEVIVKYRSNGLPREL